MKSKQGSFGEKFFKNKLLPRELHGSSPQRTVKAKNFSLIRKEDVHVYKCSGWNAIGPRVGERWNPNEPQHPVAVEWLFFFYSKSGQILIRPQWGLFQALFCLFFFRPLNVLAKITSSQNTALCFTRDPRFVTYFSASKASRARSGERFIFWYEWKTMGFND